MNYLRAIIGILLLCIGSAYAESKQNSDSVKAFFQRLQAGEKQIVVVYGTSTTEKGAWVGFLREWFAEKYPKLVTVINSGASGQTSAWGVKYMQSKVLDRHPNLVFIEFAINDAHQRFLINPQTSTDNLDKIVSGIQKQNPQIAIILQTMNGTWDCPTGFASAASDRPRLEEYYENYRAYASEHQLPLIDQYASWSKLMNTDSYRFEALIPDGVHPSKGGDQQITWANIRSFLEAAQKNETP